MLDIALAAKLQHSRATDESRRARLVLITLAIAFLASFLFLPLIVVFTEGLRHGLGEFLQALTDPDAYASIRLTLLVAAIAVPFNAAFGLAAAWAIAKFHFRGKNLLLTLIDLPF